MNRIAAVSLVFLLAVVLLPAAAAQEGQMRAGGTVVVEDGETVQNLSATAGSVVIRGTVDGNLDAVAGDIAIPGNVTGDVTAVAGSITIPGAVAGDMSAFGGRVHLTETGTVGGIFEAGAGEVVIDGVIGQDTRIEAERLTLGPTAEIGGNLVHATQAFSLSNNASISGEIRNVDSVEFVQGIPVGTSIPAWAFSLYGFVVNLTLGAILLFLLPHFSFNVIDRVLDSPLFSFLVGVLTVIVAPIILGLLAVTVIGIPLALLGLLAFVIALWMGSVYGALAIGAAVLERASITNRWAVLLVGLLIVFLLGVIPFIGALVHLFVSLTGLGALVRGGR